MTRKQYETYNYQDPDNIYTYPNSHVLINKFDEKDSDKARTLEYQLVSSQALKLIAKPILIHSMADILDIHRFLFQELYIWAGSYRKVNISKQNKPFMAMQSFETAEIYINSLIHNFHDNFQTRQEVIKGLAEILDNLNYFHPFREGNGRTQREVIRVLGLMKGFDSEINLTLDDNIYHLYMDGTVYSDLSKLETLFDEILVEI